jgi:NAD(P)-dependent dehydrogenase (short-subunit alcohol dehydrogenase family)
LEAYSVNIHGRIDMGRLEGKKVFLTGGAVGLGRSHAITLAREGADVAIFDLGDGHRDAEPGYPLATQADLDEAVEAVRRLDRRALGLVGDVRNPDELGAAVDSVVAEFGRIDILVASAGIAMMGPTWEMSREDWDLLMGTNLTGVWQSCKAVIPQMIKQHYGRIILISSTVALKGWMWLGPYCATKAGVIALGKTLAIELAEHLITVNSICPSTVPSGTNRGLAYRHKIEWESMVGGWLKTQAIQKLLEPVDISNAIVFLASDEARYLTGVALPVDAGTSAL